MTDEQVRDEALTLFLAGHETTANALTWTWYLLSQNPECERRLHRELDAVLGGRAAPSGRSPAAPLHRDGFHGSHAALSAGLGHRTHVAGAFRAGRHARSPARSIFIASPYVTHRDPRWFPDPERFDPERWTPEAREARPKFSYFPVRRRRASVHRRAVRVDGRRVSAGDLGTKWELRLAPGQKVDTLPLITLRTKYGMKMVLEKRQPA